MAITFTNIWVDKILDPLAKFIRAEFQGQVKVYKAEEYKSMGNCSIRLFGDSYRQLKYSKNGFTNEYSVEIAYYLISSNFSDERAVEKLYRDISRLEQIIFNKKQPTDRSDSAYYDGIIKRVLINRMSEAELRAENLMTAKFDFVCKYTKVS